MGLENSCEQQDLNIMVNLGDKPYLGFMLSIFTKDPYLNFLFIVLDKHHLDIFINLYSKRSFNSSNILN